MTRTIRRRQLLKATLGLGGLACASPFGWSMAPKVMASTPSFTDYKAMVCVFLYGGNDSFNMLIPADNTSFGDYRSIRGNLAVDNTKTIPIPDLNSTLTNPYATDSNDSAYRQDGIYRPNGLALGVNPVMPELARLIADKKASVVANIGPLVKPVSKADISGFTTSQAQQNLPLFLFSHNHQQRILQTGKANSLDDTGWAGRIADQWQGINSPVGLNISYFGNDRMLIGETTSPLVLNPGQPTRFSEMQNDSLNSNLHRKALFQALAGSTNEKNFATYRTDNPWQKLYGNILQKSHTTIDELYQKWQSVSAENFFSTVDPYNQSLFYPYADSSDTSFLGLEDSLSGKLIPQLDAVARMIHLGKTDYGFKRQIFFVLHGGFDTHGSQADVHPVLLRELSLGLWKFQKALEELGLENNVTTFTMSDFGRTMSNNGDGTDHAWGGHHVVMGGDGNNNSGNLNGGQLFGTVPNVTLGGNDDYSDKGRIIPTTSQDQLNATICQWFGVPTTDIETTLFPNLTNFSTKYLNLFAS